jgi:autotransporter adhesin
VNVAAGTLSATSTDAVNGSQLYQTNAQVASLGHTSLQYDTNGAGQTLSSVTLASDQGGPVIIHNLAPGVAASDAATVGQVQAVGASAVQYSTVNGVRSNTIALTGGQAGGVVISNLAPGVLGTDAANVNQVQAPMRGSTTSRPTPSNRSRKPDATRTAASRSPSPRRASITTISQARSRLRAAPPTTTTRPASRSASTRRRKTAGFA